MSRHETFRAAGNGRAHSTAGTHARLVCIPFVNIEVACDVRRVQLWSELVVLFVGVPLLMVAYFDEIRSLGSFGAFGLIMILAVLSLVAVGLLAITPGFSFRRLLSGPVLREWRLILLYSGLTAVVCTIAVFVLLPHRFLNLPLNHTVIWLSIMAAYPVLSALPQEVIYRVLFFERYGALFPSIGAGVAANAAAFGFGHLFYMHPVTIALTAIGGTIISWAYLARGRSMMLSWVLHTLAGQLVFTSGIGVYFYSGGPGPIL